jgi:hypothetical protein
LHYLGGSQPGVVQQLLADYAAYAKRNGVTEVPADYDVMKQAQANASQKSQ